MMKTRKVLSALLALLLLLAGGMTAFAEVAPAAPADEHEPYEETVTITVIGDITDQVRKNTLRDEYTMEDNPWQDAYRDYLNIEREYLWITSSADEYTMKRNLSLTSGDIPDILMVSPTEFQQLLEADVLLEIGSLYDAYASERVKNRVSEYGEIAWDYVRGEDGEIYGIPTGGGIANDERGFVWIRKDWLEKLDLAIPTNYDEFMAVVEAFVTQDPDGNGQDDTFGIAFCNKLLENNVTMRYWFNMFHADYNSWREDEDGTLRYDALRPEMKEALVALNALYEKGWIDPEFGVKDSSAIAMDIANSKVGIVFGRNWAPLSNVLMDTITAQEEADFICVPTNILGVDGEPAQSYITSSVSGMYVISKDCKNPEALIKMINLYLDLYETQYATYGITSDGREMWHLATMPTFQSPLKNMNNMIYGDKYLKGEVTEDEITPEQLQTAKNVQSYLDGDRSMWPNYRIFAYDGPNNSAEYHVLDAYNDFDAFSFLDGYLGSTTQSMIDYMSILDSMKEEAFIKIIIGDSDPDAFDAFVEEWYAAGGQQITDEVNEWYQDHK